MGFVCLRISLIRGMLKVIGVMAFNLLGANVEYYLGTPVLALIPEPLTPYERSRRRRLRGLRWLGLALMMNYGDQD